LCDAGSAMSSDKLLVIFYIYLLLENENDEIKSSEKDIHSEKTEEHDTRKSWKDVINKPSQWKAVHSTKVCEFSPFFDLYPLFCPPFSFANNDTSFIFVF
jgi:hypothetical protein